MRDSSNIDEFLAQARSEGTFHSQGTFSLDPVRARELLSRYQLPDDDWYVLKLVQFAVAAGADEIRFTNSNQALQATIVGWQLDFFDTARVMASLVENPLTQEGPLRHLSVAFQAAMAQSPLSVEWSVWNAYQQEKIAFDSGGVRFERLMLPPFSSRSGNRYLAGYVFSLNRPIQARASTTGWFARLGEVLLYRAAATSSVATVHSLISSKCRFSPVRVVLDGREVNQPLDFFDQDYQADPRVIILDGSRNRIGLPGASALQGQSLFSRPHPAVFGELCSAARTSPTAQLPRSFLPLPIEVIAA